MPQALKISSGNNKTAAHLSPHAHTTEHDLIEALLPDHAIISTPGAGNNCLLFAVLMGMIQPTQLPILGTLAANLRLAVRAFAQVLATDRKRTWGLLHNIRSTIDSNYLDQAALVAASKRRPGEMLTFTELCLISVLLDTRIGFITDQTDSKKGRT